MYILPLQHKMNTLTPSNTKPLCWFESGESLEWITEHLQKTDRTIRIATAFFTIKGWNLIRRYTTDKKTYILVGLEDPGEQRAKIALAGLKQVSTPNPA